MNISYALIAAIVCQSTVSAIINVDKEVSRSVIATRNHSSLEVLSVTEGDHGHAREISIKTSLASTLSAPHGSNLLQIAGRIDWKIAKVVLGVVLLLPALPSMIGWQLSGHAAHPFLLDQDSVPSWSNNLYELVAAMALLGVDLILLAGVEYDWQLTMYWLRIILFLQYGLLGFACHFYGVISENSPYQSVQENVPVPTQKDNDAEGEDASTHTAAPLQDSIFSHVMGSVENVRSSVGHIQSGVKRWVHIPPPLVAETQYQDVGTPLVRLCLLTLAQTILIYFYFQSMEEEVMVLTPTAYSFWMAAIPVQIVAKTQMGTPFSQEICFWNDIFHADAGAVVQRGDDESMPTIKLSYVSCLIRSAMSFYTNCFCIALIALTLPLFLLSAASQSDFVKDCFAVVFITTLDDLSESVALRIKPPLPA